MAEDYLFCNYKNCQVPITKYCWVTRCSHVFCEKHGNSFFMNNKSKKIKCPACNESNNRQTDIIRSNLNPHDMLVTCVRPEKALDYVVNATKLWSYQMTQKRKVDTDMLCEKYEKLASEAMSKIKTENTEMKRFIMEVEQKLKFVTRELDNTKNKLFKYKVAYNNLAQRTQHGPSHDSHSNFFPEYDYD